MLSITKVRELVGPGCSLTDQQLEDERDRLYALARAILSRYQRNPLALERHSANQEEALEERAAIIELEAGITRIATERAALRQKEPRLGDRP